MWTRRDNYIAGREGWMILSFGLYTMDNKYSKMHGGIRKHIEDHAKDGSELHIKAIQHLALCKLLNISAAPKD